MAVPSIAELTSAAQGPVETSDGLERAGAACAAGLRAQSPCCSRLWTVKSLRSGGFGKARSPSCWMTGMSLF